MDFGATVALIARLTLAAAFAFSAATKVTQRAAFAEGLDDFGVPASGVFSWALPLVEGGLAVTLVAVRGSAWPAFLAIAVLAVFTGAVVANLVGGRAAPCPCFGPPSAAARPVSATTVARNGGLVALAVLGTGSTDGASLGAALVISLAVVPAMLVVLRRYG